MRDNVLQSESLLNQVFQVSSATDNFCNGHPCNINFKLKTNFKDMDAVNKVINKIYAKKIQECKIVDQSNIIFNLVDLTINSQTSNESIEEVSELNTTTSDTHEQVGIDSLIQARYN